jgi:hypothetical protein
LLIRHILLQIRIESLLFALKSLKKQLMRYWILPLLTLSLQILGAQNHRDITQWSLSLDAVDAHTYEVTATVQIKEGWYVYSLFLAPDEGPIPTSFQYKNGIRQISRREAGNKHEVFDPIFEMHLAKFSETALFTSRVQVPPGVKQIEGSYIYMTCDDTKCLPPVEQPFTLDLP